MITKISRDGPISFKTFMEMALYDPEWGYYSTSREHFGAEGDFYTSPDVHPLFGKMIARQLAQMAEMIPDRFRFDVVEGGPGNGLLAFHILKSLQEDHSHLFSQLTYYMVESSPSLLHGQKCFFHSMPEIVSKIKWLTSFNDLPMIEGCVLSNELIDSFPVHRVIWKTGLHEIYVDYDGGQFIEILRPPSPEIENYFKGFSINWIDGQEAEVNVKALSWLKEVGKKLGKGFVLTIDYGDLAEGFYTIRRKKGTLLCYRNHQVYSDPYQWIGEQDMTSHVNFSSLLKGGIEENLAPLGYTDQAHFLIGLGILDDIERHVQTLEDPRRDHLYRAMKHLIHPEGLGSVFKVLIQQKGVGDFALDGLKFSRKTGLI